MPLNETYGKYAPVPNVVIDRCDLSAEVKWAYTTLYRVCWTTNGLYSGSYAKLAETLRTSKNKAYRMVKALEAARMLKTSDDSDKLAMTLNSISLWILNGLYEFGLEVPYFTDVVAALDIVLKIERSEQEITAIDVDAVLNLARIGLNLERIVLFLERFGLNLERFGLFLERLKVAISELEKPVEEASKNAPIISNSNNKSNSNKGAANASSNPSTRKTTKPDVPKPESPKEPVFALNEQEQSFWILWCNVWFNKDIPPKLNATAYSHIQKLAPHITTAEQLDSLITFTRKDLEGRGIKQKTVALGNLINSYRGWKQMQPIPFPSGNPYQKPTRSYVPDDFGYDDEPLTAQR